jgi:hypothetical protein
VAAVLVAVDADVVLDDVRDDALDDVLFVPVAMITPEVKINVVGCTYSYDTRR